jgi:Leucine-rich repeat (LRR) protein
MILKGSWSVLFGFNELEVNSLMIKSIRPDAEFLFTNLKRLIIKRSDILKIQDMPSIINQFQAINVSKKIDFITIGVKLRSEVIFSSPVSYNIKALDVWNNNFDFLKVNLSLLDQLEELTITSLMDKNVNLIHPLANYSHLKKLSIKCKINHAYLSDNTEDFENLTELELEMNGLTSLEPSSIKHFNQLEKLAIKFNDLSGIAPGTFSSLNNLVDLNLAHNNKMQKLTKDLFIGLESLRNLDLNGCGIKTIESGSFNGLGQLKVLKLNRCKINSIAPDAFVPLTNLDLLDLSCNELVNVDIKCAPKAFKAKENKLESIVFSADDLLRLEEVYLDQNRFINFNTNAMFCNRDINVKHFDIHFNKILKLDEACMSNMKQLTKLNLDFNPIAELSTNAFHGLENLKDLEFTISSLDLLQKGLFFHLRKLKILTVGFIETKRKLISKIMHRISLNQI